MERHKIVANFYDAVKETVDVLSIYAPLYSYNWLLSATKMRSNKNQQNCRSTLSPLTGGKLLPGWFLAKSHIVFSGMRQLFFVTLSLNNLGFGIKWRLHYIYFRFSLQVYTVNFCKSEKRILPPQTWMAIKHTHNVDICNSYECYSPQTGTIS